MSFRSVIAAVMCTVLVSPASASAAALRARQQPSRPSIRDVEVLKTYAAALPIGSLVKVRLLSGEQLRGTLMHVDATEVIVRPKTRIPEPERRIAFADLDLVELDRGGGHGTAVLIGVGSAVATFLSLWLVALAVIDD